MQVRSDLIRHGVAVDEPPISIRVGACAVQHEELGDFVVGYDGLDGDHEIDIVARRALDRAGDPQLAPGAGLVDVFHALRTTADSADTPDA